MRVEYNTIFSEGVHLFYNKLSCIIVEIKMFKQQYDALKFITHGGRTHPQKSLQHFATKEIVKQLSL